VTFSLINPVTFEVIGVLGFALYVLNYMLLTLRVLCGDCIKFFVLNLLAASCVLIGLSVSFNLASALIQVFWITLSIIAIALRLYRRRSDPTQMRGALQ